MWAACRGVWSEVLISLSSGSSLFSSILTLAVLQLMVLSLILALLTSRVFSGLSVYMTVAVLLLLTTGVMAVICRQPQDPSPLPFRVSEGLPWWSSG